MSTHWNDKDPIYRQLYDRFVAMILEGVFAEGDSLPSVRQIAAEERINPITVSKAYQMLVDDGVVEKRRGLGMFVVNGAHEKLMTNERKTFLSQEWPQVLRKIDRLGLTPAQLLEPDHE